MSAPEPEVSKSIKRFKEFLRNQKPELKEKGMIKTKATVQGGSLTIKPIRIDLTTGSQSDHEQEDEATIRYVADKLGFKVDKKAGNLIILNTDAIKNYKNKESFMKACYKHFYASTEQLERELRKQQLARDFAALAADIKQTTDSYNAAERVHDKRIAAFLHPATPQSGSPSISPSPLSGSPKSDGSSRSKTPSSESDKDSDKSPMFPSIKGGKKRGSS